MRTLVLTLGVFFMADDATAQEKKAPPGDWTHAVTVRIALDASGRLGNSKPNVHAKKKTKPDGRVTWELRSQSLIGNPLPKTEITETDDAGNETVWVVTKSMKAGAANVPRWFCEVVRKP